MDYPSFERQLLRLIFTSNAPLTPVHVAYYLDCPIAEARQHLDRMLAEGSLELDSDDAGHLLYVYPQRPTALPAPRRRRRRRASPVETPPDEPIRYSPAAAAALSLFLPGVGQIYSGRVAQGIGWLVATGLGYLLFLVPGLILHICCIVNAAAVPSPMQTLALVERT